ncbi:MULTISPECIES: DUF1350 family protein [unclassified Nodularia (in: cyanobacteria)]|uniref:DUF1350 family protein n=1 Tax=unclassified Nodularia (in: cyanobacteria) TaxID=2656917 RepID=UPI0018818EB0|nr:MULTISPECIES: DUF1350 family protein [unclassified Nodularia (in: cyanobacteria)]MBE9198469.1 DUF1350 family protein [Nodularia sp. LEGE 06071]MCC2691066.1 DUF1350 family protein [Nodularia sp. LEGE 04288]
MKPKMKFQPVSHSWVALHPEAKGVIQFIGGAFFGTFIPMVFYQHLLKSLYEQKYTIIILPFNFTFNHYEEAGFLIREQYEIMPEVVRISNLLGYDSQVYLNDTNFSWMGHSIGCKYISLLEGFTALPTDSEELEKFIRQLVSETSNSQNNERKIKSIVTDLEILINDLQQKRAKTIELIKYYLKQNIGSQKLDSKDAEVTIASIFIKGQVSVLLAPVNTGIDSAIKPKILANLITKLGFDVKPTPEETYALIKDSNLFNLLAILRFKSDNIARGTCDWFINTLGKPPQDLWQELPGGHLRPLGIQIGNFVINFPDTLSIPVIEPSQKRTAGFESHVIGLLKDLSIKK